MLATLVQAIRTLGDNLAPFLPGTAARIAQQGAVTNGRLSGPHRVFERIEAAPPS